MNTRPDKTRFEEVAELRQILPAFVEKDWFVTQVIGIISTVSVTGFHVIFTGGTALSRAHRLLERFSEDVDFRVRVDGEPKRPALSAFKNTIVEALRSGGFAIDQTRMRARDANRFFLIDLDYESYFTQADALRPHIQIEVSVRATQLPPLELPVASFVNETSKKPAEVSRISCIDPVESAADKLSALAWRVPDRVRGGDYDDPSIVRHIHDLAILKERALVSTQFSALVMSAMQTDSTRPKNKPGLANVAPHEKLYLMLKTLSEDKEYEAEYERFVGGVSYADAANVPHYATAVNAVRLLVNAVEE